MDLLSIPLCPIPRDPEEIRKKWGSVFSWSDELGKGRSDYKYFLGTYSGN